MKYIFTTLLLASAILALPTDFSSQESTTAATQEEAGPNPIGLLGDTLGLRRRGVLTSIESSAKRGNQVARQMPGDDDFNPDTWTPFKRGSQVAQKTTAEEFDGPFGPGLTNGVAFKRDVTSTESPVKRDNQDAQKATVDDAYLPDLGAWTNFKRDNQDAQEATAKDFEGPFGPGLPNGVAF
ncbi:hypothetical protein AtubIFM56815_007083 [Aspergillus tubingensis]|uniref:Uncharacterized protein n=1 Tax=Aspergillus tubingensis TaxID=5068 RepID=A0A9W6AJW5_ASPTU|nr:hypothetical protein AtubIFM54640_003687 [Aspergillus tubingensis]GLA82892.1 hypothetical protein AtubIFM56815_007083 [Aspergillus tubingensis]